MSVSVTVTPGKVFRKGEKLTNAKLNQAAKPTIAVSAAVAPADLSAGDYNSKFYSAPCIQGASKRLSIANNAGSPTTTVDVAADEIILKSTDGNHRAYLAVNVSKSPNIDNDASATDGGRDTGSVATGWWFLYLCYDGSSQKVLYSMTAPAGGGAPSTANFNYTYFAFLGCVYVKSTGPTVLKRLMQFGDRVWIAASDNEVFTGKQGATTFTQLSGADLTAFQAAVPTPAMCFWGVFGRTDTNAVLAAVELAGIDTNAQGGVTAVFDESVTALLYSMTRAAPYPDVFISGNNFYWRYQEAGATTNSRWRVGVSGYRLK